MIYFNINRFSSVYKMEFVMTISTKISILTLLVLSASAEAQPFNPYLVANQQAYWRPNYRPNLYQNQRYSQAQLKEYLKAQQGTMIIKDGFINPPSNFSAPSAEFSSKEGFINPP